MQAVATGLIPVIVLIDRGVSNHGMLRYLDEYNLQTLGSCFPDQNPEGILC